MQPEIISLLVGCHIVSILGYLLAHGNISRAMCVCVCVSVCVSVCVEREIETEAETERMGKWGERKS